MSKRLGYDGTASVLILYLFVVAFSKDIVFDNTVFLTIFLVFFFLDTVDNWVKIAYE